MSELPEGWVQTKLLEVVSRRDERAEPGSIADLPFVGLEEVESNTGRIKETKRTGDLKSSVARFYAGDVLYGRLRPYLNKVVLADFTGAASAEFIVLPPSEGIDNKFLQYLLMSRDFVSFTGLISTGDRPRVKFESIGEYEIALPPISEQRRIVAKLDSLFKKTKRAREELGNVPRMIERYKQCILAAAFRGDLTADWRAANRALEPVENLVARTPQPEQTRGGREATETVIEGRAAISVNLPARLPPENWSWVSLRRIARQETGHTPSRKHPDYWDGDIPWIGIRDAAKHHAGVIMDTSQHVTEQGLENSSARLLPTGTVCLSRTASVGYVVMMGRAMATSQDFVTWTCTDALDPKYLMYALLAEGDDIRRFGKGSTHTTIYFPEVRAFQICLAPIDEQKEIVRRIEDAFIWIEKIDQEHDAAIGLLDRLDKSILQKAFRGKLVPQDPNDEPAIKLLQRIREERARLKEEKPPRKRQRRTGLETPMVETKPSRRPVVEVISEKATPVSPERLFQLAGFAPEDVDAFYVEIKQAVLAGKIEQDSEKNLVPVR